MAILETAGKLLLALLEERSEQVRVPAPPVIRKVPEKRRLVWQKYVHTKTTSLMSEEDLITHVQNLLEWRGESGTSPIGMRAINSVAALRIFWEGVRKLEIKNLRRG